MERRWMRVSVYVYENREGMFEAHLVHSWRGGTGTRRAEVQTEISGGAIKEGRRDSVSIKGIMTLPLFDSPVTSVVVFSFHLNWRGPGSARLHEARSAEIQTEPTFLTWEKRQGCRPEDTVVFSFNGAIRFSLRFQSSSLFFSSFARGET